MAKPPSMASTPSILPICNNGTRPMNIMSTITPNSITAVEKFSGSISPHIVTVNMSTYFMARLSAPFSVCMDESMYAVVMTREPLAISDGWSGTPNTLSQRTAPFTSTPQPIKRQISVTNEKSRPKGIRILK